MYIRRSQVKPHRRSRWRIHAVADTARFAQQLSRAVGASVVRLRVHRFPDGESLVRIRPPARDCAVLRREADAPLDLREKSLYLAARLLEIAGVVGPSGGYRTAQQVLDSGAAERVFNRIVSAQGACELPPQAPYRQVVEAPTDGRIREIDCWEIARVAKRAGAPANPAAGVRLVRTVGDVVARGEPLFEIHAQSEAQLEFGRAYAKAHPEIIRFRF